VSSYESLGPSSGNIIDYYYYFDVGFDNTGSVIHSLKSFDPFLFNLHLMN